jgi:glycosyltransferase involved in cell wall biosynthesis
MAAPRVVSCIVPVFNGERYLGDALDSIAAQTHRALEIIVVDDGSTDGTAAVARASRHAVRYVAQANAGPASARNRGVREASGDFVAFLDADDRWHPEKTERQLRRFAARPELGVCVAHAAIFHDGATPAGGDGRPAAGTAIAAYATSSMLARRAAFARVGPFDAKLKHADDTDWFLRARSLGVLTEMLDDVLVQRRLHAENMSLTGRTESVGEYLRLIKADLDRRRRAAGGTR